MSHIKHLMEQKFEEELAAEVNSDTSPEREDTETGSDEDAVDRGYD